MSSSKTGSQFAASNMFDRDEDTFWHSNRHDDQDFGVTVTFNVRSLLK